MSRPIPQAAINAAAKSLTEITPNLYQDKEIKMSEPVEWSERIDQAIQQYPEVGEYLEAIRGNIEALAGRLKAVEVLHQEEMCSGGAACCDPLCGECGDGYPCPTVKAARGE